MVTRSQKIRMASFLIIGFSILLIIIILLIGSEFTERRDLYQIVYEDTSVAGLQIGSAVLFRGIRIGRVEAINIDRESINSIIVTISVVSGTPVKSDQLATLVSVGITGIKQIELSGGTNESPFLKSGDTIIAGRTLFDSLTDSAEIMVYRIEQVLENLVAFTGSANQERFSSILQSIDQVTTDTELSIISTIKNVDIITDELTVATAAAKEILVKLNDLLSDDRVSNIISNTETISASLAEIDFSKTNDILERTNEAINRAALTIARIDAVVQRNSPDLTAIIEELREALENLSEFTRVITEDPSILIRSRRHD